MNDEQRSAAMEKAREKALQEFPDPEIWKNYQCGLVHRAIWNEGFDAGYDAGKADGIPHDDAREWVRIEGRPENLPGWPKSYLWLYKTRKGVPAYTVRRYEHYNRDYFASIFLAWCELPPYTEEKENV